LGSINISKKQQGKKKKEHKKNTKNIAKATKARGPRKESEEDNGRIGARHVGQIQYFLPQKKSG